MIPLAGAILSAWLQYAAAGPQARAIVSAPPCPRATLDGRAAAMTLRAAPAPGFPNAVCTVDVPLATTTVKIADRTLPAPLATSPRTIAVVGDTGCRIVKGLTQACNDPAAWPFPGIARAIAAAHPDLVIHVGDYLYREAPCPAGNRGCAASPSGDTAAAWDADWFAPGAPLFAAAPLVVVRGNHESCARGGPGWFRDLDPGTSTACTDATPPYAVALEGLRIVVLDSASANDTQVDPRTVGGYRTAFDAARSLAWGPTWLVTHRPPYTNATERAAMGALPYDALVAGHIHLFAALDVAGRPPLVVNGESGDLLDVALAPLLTVALGSLRPSSPPYVAAAFGFALYTSAVDGWTISLRDARGAERKRCTLARREVRC